MDVEAVHEPSVLGGRPITEVSYVDFEPWLVFLVNGPRNTRYIVAVSPAGAVLDVMRLTMSEFEPFYSVLPPRE